MQTVYTLQDLEKAKIELAAQQERSDNYSGNNPDKHRTATRVASENVALITAALKASGAIALSPQEELEKALDRQYPKARSKEIVQYNGSYYQRKFTPGGKSLSGKTVTSWIGSWVEVPPPK